jgi:hypothetical protein
LRAGTWWSSTVFAHELSPRAASFEPENGLYTFALTMPSEDILQGGPIQWGRISGAFQIDHPLEPESKYLVHSFVESPDMKNISMMELPQLIRRARL